MKQCAICHQSLNESEFYVNAKGRPTSYCKPCHRKRQAQWDADNRARKLEINRDWRARNPGRRKRINDATNALWKAIRSGNVVRGVACESCGSNCRIEAAHYDYSKPLDVKWLCTSCHRKWDSQAPKSLVALT